MEQDKLDIRNKTKDELIDSYDLIARTILEDIKNFENIHEEEINKEN